jgi:hypothetical protein
MHKQVLEMFKQGVLPSHPGLSPARLFHCLYQSNLLRNTSFLERENAVKAAGAPRQQAWVSCCSLACFVFAAAAS